MNPKPLVALPVTLKLRCEEREGRPTVVATMWVGEEKKQELATLDLVLVEGPEDPLYRRWLDAIGAAFVAFLKRETELDGIVSRRDKPVG